MRSYLIFLICSCAVQTAQDKLDDSRVALERKAKLYEKLAAGQYADDGELYNVDFLQKATLGEEQQSLEREASARRQQGTPEQPLDTAAGLLSSAGEAFTVHGPEEASVGTSAPACISVMLYMLHPWSLIIVKFFMAGLDRIVFATASCLRPGRRLGMQPGELVCVQSLKLALAGIVQA